MYTHNNGKCSEHTREQDTIAWIWIEDLKEMILQEKGDSDNTIESTVCHEILKCLQCITGSDNGSLRWLMEWTV